MEATVQEQIDSLQAQLKMLQLQEEVAALEREKAVTAPVVPPPTPADAPTPLPQPVASHPPTDVLAVPPPPLPADDVLACTTWDGVPIKCMETADLVDFDQFIGGSLPSLDRAINAVKQLSIVDNLLPILGGLGALYLGYVGVSAASESLRPDDAATAKRKREERERLGLTEWDEEQKNQAAFYNWVAVVLVVGFELVLFNLRNVGVE